MRQHEEKVLLLLTLVIGAVVGLVVVAFILVTENLVARLYPAGAAAWRRVLIPAGGSLCAGVLLKRYFPNARGSGIPQTKAALFLQDGFISLRTAVGKFFCSSITLASGVALGREGPSVQIGAGIASVLGRRLGLSPARLKELLPAGTSAALAAAFNTPISAVLFTLEEVLGDLHAPVLGSVVLSSATAWMVLRVLLGDEPLFHVPAYQLVHPAEFLLYAVLGLIGGLVSVCFVKLLLYLRRRYLALPRWTVSFQPATGGLMVGILGWFLPEVLGVGYAHVSAALNGGMAFRTMALLVLLKVIATAGCYASGNAGGIFGPSLFIGAMTGGVVGTAAHYLLPDYTAGVGAYALVGMGTAFAGIIRAPLTSVIMIFEITRDYSIVVPVMISNLVSFFISQRLQKEPIYEALQHQDGVHLPPGGRRHEEPLAARQAMQAPARVLSPEDTPARILPDLLQQEPGVWPVAGASGLLGMVSVGQLQEAVDQGRGERPLAELLPDPDLLGPLRADNFPHVHPDHPLEFVLRRMAEHGSNVLPVVSRTNLRQLQGIITLHNVLEAYGLGKGRPEFVESPELGAAPAGKTGITLAALLAVTAGVLILVGSLTYYYRSQRRATAAREFALANELIRQGRDPEAIEKLRHALSISHAREHRLALALELAKAGQFGEAELYLRQLAREDPGNAIVNLGLARIAASEKRTDQAVTYYQRAIYGTWPEAQPQMRIEARLELADFLAKTGAKKRAVSELLSLVESAPEADTGLRKRIGRLLLAYGSPQDAADVYADVLRRDRRDPEACLGLGNAYFAQAEYVPARDAFRRAVRLDPANREAQERLSVCEEIVALDPTLGGIGPAERYRRSRALIAATLGALEQCAVDPGGAADVRFLSQKARQALSSRRTSAYDDAAERNVAEAERLWTAREKMCGPPDASQEALSRVMARIRRSSPGDQGLLSSSKP